MKISIEWYRDLTIIILGFLIAASLIFMTIVIYHLHRKLETAMDMVNAAAKTTNDTAIMVQNGIRPLFSGMALIKGIKEGLQVITNICKKEDTKGEEKNE